MYKRQGQQVFDILRDPGGDAAPFAIALPAGSKDGFALGGEALTGTVHRSDRFCVAMWFIHLSLIHILNVCMSSGESVLSKS